MIDVPYGSILESRRPACARHKRPLQQIQREKGWRFPEELVVEPDPLSKDQRAMATAEHDRLATA